MKNICPICYYDNLFEPPYDSDGYGSDEICPCCGFHFGYDDYPNKEKQITEWRQRWISDGCQWFSKKRKPPIDWMPKDQLNKEHSLS